MAVRGQRHLWEHACHGADYFAHQRGPVVVLALQVFSKRGKALHQLLARQPHSLARLLTGRGASSEAEMGQSMRGGIQGTHSTQWQRALRLRQGLAELIRCCLQHLDCKPLSHLSTRVQDTHTPIAEHVHQGTLLAGVEAVRARDHGQATFPPLVLCIEGLHCSLLCFKTGACFELLPDPWYSVLLHFIGLAGAGQCLGRSLTFRCITLNL
mmetsp:Transcript_7341/g.19628  ORF Transcript_7341/g.19628 Transcript_7341/m.19628 type:complete len:211 (+) Transcript_7341:1433-2065(+)